MITLSKMGAQAKVELEEMKKQKAIDFDKHNRYVVATTAEIKNSEIRAQRAEDQMAETKREADEMKRAFEQERLAFHQEMAGEHEKRIKIEHDVLDQISAMVQNQKQQLAGIGIGGKGAVIEDDGDKAGGAGGMGAPQQEPMGDYMSMV